MIKDILKNIVVRVLTARRIHVQEWCKACVLLEGLNRGMPKLGIGRTRGVNGDQMKMKNHRPAGATKSIESKQCGSLDF